MVTKTPDELAILKAEYGEAGVKAHFQKEREHVFGVGYRTDKNGKPVEQGIGAPGNESEQHFQALQKYEGKAVADAARAKAAKAAG
jgi:hypothetical protein